MVAMAGNGNLSLPDNIQFVDAGSLGPNALGAYNAENGGTIYLDSSLLNDPKALESIYAEELGHHIDTQLGGPDASGDEGAIFSKALFDGPVSAAQLAELKSENDSGFIEIDGKRVAVEFHRYCGVGSSTASGGTGNSSSSSGSSSNYSSDSDSDSDRSGSSSSYSGTG